MGIILDIFFCNLPFIAIDGNHRKLLHSCVLSLAIQRLTQFVHVSMASEFQPKLSSARRHLCSHPFVTNLLRFLWVVFVIGGELGIFFWSLSECRWPSIDLGHHVGNHSLMISYFQLTPSLEISTKSDGHTCLAPR